MAEEALIKADIEEKIKRMREVVEAAKKASIKT